jgi:hypothetical protein
MPANPLAARARVFVCEFGITRQPIVNRGRRGQLWISGAYIVKTPRSSCDSFANSVCQGYLYFGRGLFWVPASCDSTMRLPYPSAKGVLPGLSKFQQRPEKRFRYLGL